MNGFKIINDGVDNNPVISVAIRAYKHEKFIGQTIESVLMQNTGYSYEIVIADDLSPDNTRKVITEYQKKYPQKIKLILQDENVGHNKNQITLLTNLSGKYVALLDGDDYWTDPLKLQKQVDFLEHNADFSCCFHDVKALKNGKLEDDVMPEVADVTTVTDLAMECYIRISSFVFRNHLIKEFPKEIITISGDDYFHFLLVAKYGKIKKFHQVMSVYRRHDDTMTTSMDEMSRHEHMIKNLEVLLPYFDGKARQNLQESHAIKVFYFIIFLADNGLVNEGKDIALKSINANAETIFKEISIVFKDKFVLSRQQESLSFNLKNTFKLIKKRLTR